MHRSDLLRRQINWRLLPIQSGIVLTVALIPLWKRLPQTPPFFADLYVSRFLILLPVAWTIGWWLILGLPGFTALRKDTMRALWALALLSLGIWAYASQDWAFVRISHPEIARNAALQLGMVALFAVVTACAAPPKRILIAVLVVSLIWNGIVSDIQVASQGSTGSALLESLGEFRLGVDQDGISVIQAGDVRWLRPYGLLSHPNVLAGVLVIGLLAAVHGTTSARRRIRWITTAIFLFGLWALLLTFSRGAWLGLAAGALAIYPLLRRTHLQEKSVQRHLWLTVGLALLTGLIFVAVYRPLIVARTGTSGESIEMRSVSDRLVFTRFALRAVAENPIGGVGIGNFPWRSSYYLVETAYDLRGDNVHHVALLALAELGIVGFGLLTIALILGIEAALRSIKRGANDSIMLLGGVMALMIIGLFDHYPWTLIQFQAAWWGLLALAMAPPLNYSAAEAAQAR